MYEHCKRHGQANPESAHQQGLFERNHSALAAHDREIKNQQDENRSVKDNPEPNVHGND
jgi:hypothetical protein